MLEVAAQRIAGDEADGVRHALELVAVCPHQLEHIRILLVRHDAGACGQRVRQVDEAEVLAGEQQPSIASRPTVSATDE